MDPRPPRPDAAAAADDRMRERALARRIWRSVVPTDLQDTPDYRLDLHSAPADAVGGDFHLVSDDGWLVVGDVSGKGIPAALMTGMLVSSLRLALRTPDPAGALDVAVGAELERAEMFATLVAVRLAPDGRIEVLNAGHPPLLIARANGGLDRVGAGAPPIGVVRGLPVATVGADLEPGDTLILASDGVHDAVQGDEPFGQARLEACAAEVRARSSLAPVLAALSGWSAHDDVTLVSATYDPSERAIDDVLDRR